jgi:hypothetical protein
MFSPSTIVCLGCLNCIGAAAECQSIFSTVTGAQGLSGLKHSTLCRDIWAQNLSPKNVNQTGDDMRTPVVQGWIPRKLQPNHLHVQPPCHIYAGVKGVSDRNESLGRLAPVPLPVLVWMPRKFTVYFAAFTFDLMDNAVRVHRRRTGSARKTCPDH